MEPMTTQVSLRCETCLAFGRDAQCRHPQMILGVLLVVLLCTGAAARAQGCPPGTFEYSPCHDGAAQVVLNHGGTGAGLLPDPVECARAERDLGLLGALDNGIGPGSWVAMEILIETLAPADPDLVCMNLYYQATSFLYAGFDDWWEVRFPHPINEPAIATIYSTLPAVLDATVNAVGGFGCGPAGIFYWPRPNGTWLWTFVSYGYFHGCRQSVSSVYVSQGGQVMRPGDLNCDGVVNGLDVPLFVELLITPAAFSGCDPYLADLNHDGATDAADVQQFIRLLIP